MSARERETSLTYRCAGSPDVQAVVALVHSAYRGDASRQGWTTEANLLAGQRTDAEAVREVIGQAGSLLLLAFREGTLAGCCQLVGSDSQEGAYFGMFAIRPALQGIGLGGAVLSEAERIVRTKWGARTMRMTVIRQRDELIAWYRRQGYEPTGETAPFPYGNERYGIPLRPDLEFVVLKKRLD